MGTCNYCGRNGWFLRVSARSLCAQCDPVVTKEIPQRVQTISDSKKRLEASGSLDDKISACQIMINEAEALVKYEKRGIATTNPAPSKLLEQAKNDKLVLKSLEIKINEAQSKSDLAENYKEKFTLLSSALVEVESSFRLVSRPELLKNIQSELEYLIREVFSFPALLTYSELKSTTQDLQRQITETRRKNNSLPHLLLCGLFEPAQTAVALQISREMGVNIKYASAALIQRPGDLAALLTNLDEGDIFLIQQIEFMKKVVLEVLLSALADFQIDIMIGQGPSATSIKLDLKRFTLIATTTKPANVDKFLRQSMVIYDFFKAATVSVSLADFVGQERLKNELRARIDTAKSHSHRLPHLLLCGPDECGKATLARAIAAESGQASEFIDAGTLVKSEDIEIFLSSLIVNEVVIIDRIDLLKESVIDILVQALANASGADSSKNRSDVAIAQKSRQKQFTLIGTTSRPSQVDKRLRRWMVVYDLVSYSAQEIAEILQVIAKGENLSIGPDAAALLAEHCDGSPGNAKVLIKRVGDFIHPYGSDRITVQFTNEALTSFGFVGRPSTSADLATKLCRMSGLDFEEFVAKLFRDQGYSVELTPGSGDHGIDLMLRKDNEFVVAQCKRWNASIGEPVIRDFYGSLMGAGAQSGYVVTTGTFTSQAYSFVRGKPIQLVDLDALLNWASDKRYE